MKRIAIAILLAAACGSSPPPEQPHAVPAVTATWDVPAGWKHEVIPFPLEFAPSLHHGGLEELRFPPGFLDPKSDNYWSYAFVWRTSDAAPLDAAAVGAELTEYFRGLLVSVDGDKHRVDATQITATATEQPSLPKGAFAIEAHVVDAFGDARPLVLYGLAQRIACNSGAVWRFSLSREHSPLHATLDELAAKATCDQAAVK